MSLEALSLELAISHNGHDHDLLSSAKGNVEQAGSLASQHFTYQQPS
jgi:hypothetical protein